VSSSLAVELFVKLLFPEDSAEPHIKERHSVKSEETRAIIYDLITSLSEHADTHEKLTALCIKAQSSVEEGVHDWSGRSKYLRAEHSHLGLRNLGQTCYLNSLLQQLFMNIAFRKFILETAVTDPERQQVLWHMQQVFSGLHLGVTSSYAPTDLARVLDIDVTIQEDAPIFFTMLIGRLEDSMPDEDSKKALQAFFGGRNKSQTRGQCGHVSESTDDYFNLSLTVKDKANLLESLEEYVSGAALEGGDKFKCETCEAEGNPAYVNAMRRTGLEHIPDTLVVGLKRFRYETFDGGTKVNDRFEFPPRIDMMPYKLDHRAAQDSSAERDDFELIGVVVHQGTLQFGHYWSYAKDHRSYGHPQGSWFRMEDAAVTKSDLDTVMRECFGGEVQYKNGYTADRPDSAYVLFYRRLGSTDDKDIAELVRAAADIKLTPEIVSTNTANNDRIAKGVHLLDDAHAKFVLSLLHGADNRELTDRSATSDFGCEAVELGLVFIQNVLGCKQDGKEVEPCASAVETLARSTIRNAAMVLDWISDSANSYMWYFGRAAIRAAANTLVTSSLKYMRGEAPELYGLHTTNGSLGCSEDSSQDYLYHVIKAHNALNHNPFERRAAWSSYLSLPVEIAAWGPRETALVLDLGYLGWLMRIILTNMYTDYSNRNRDLDAQMQMTNVSWKAIVDALYGLFRHYIDLSDLSSGKRKNDSRSHQVVDGLCRLNAEEIRDLTYIFEQRQAIVEEICGLVTFDNEKE